jgi:hypothetical protein
MLSFVPVKKLTQHSALPVEYHYVCMLLQLTTEESVNDLTGTQQRLASEIRSFSSSMQARTCVGKFSGRQQLVRVAVTLKRANESRGSSISETSHQEIVPSKVVHTLI